MILSVDSSAVTASVALTDGKKVIKSEFINAGLTHSETLLPMIKRVMGDYKISARRMQFYNALFEIKNGKAVRLCDDRAISIDDLKNDLKKYEKVIVAGDGARLCYDNLGIDNIILAPEDKRYQCGQGVALAAENKEKISAAALMPVYLRLSQAERELKLKKKDKEN